MHSAPAWECRLRRSASSGLRALRSAQEDAERPGRHSHGGPWERGWSGSPAQRRQCMRPRICPLEGLKRRRAQLSATRSKTAVRFVGDRSVNRCKPRTLRAKPNTAASRLCRPRGGRRRRLISPSPALPTCSEIAPTQWACSRIHRSRSPGILHDPRSSRRPSRR